MDKDVNDLHLKSSDAKDCSKWFEVKRLEGIGVTVTSGGSMGGDRPTRLGPKKFRSPT